jgi:DNA-binding transcriptional MerR regulator
LNGRPPRGHVERMYFRIGEAAQLVGEKPHVLRYWESEFRCIRPTKSSSGQRVYSRRDIDSLLKVKSLLKDQRFTIEGARRRLREGGVEPPPVAQGEAPRGDVTRMRGALVDLRREAVELLERLERGS